MELTGNLGLGPSVIILSIIGIGLFFHCPSNIDQWQKIIIGGAIVIGCYLGVNLYQYSQSKPSNKTEWKLINLIHMLILAPLFIYLGMNKSKSDPVAHILLITCFLFAIGFHGIKLGNGFNAPSLVHVLIGLGGIYMSMSDTKPDWYYNGLMITGIYAGLKHAYNFAN